MGHFFDSLNFNITGAHLAEVLNLTPARISQLTNDGTFNRRQGGYDLEECVRAYCRLAKIGPTSAAMAAAKLRKAEADARMAESMAMAAEGKTIAVIEVESLVAQMGAAVRAALLSLRQTLPERLTGLDAQEVSVELDKEIRRVMQIIYDCNLPTHEG
ncbi:MAG: hypothetical protein RLZ22_116 [Verrucomicrobiota bacterium]|jgi:phage terminase Nu1 subunit (DNA packaging protein)